MPTPTEDWSSGVATDVLSSDDDCETSVRPELFEAEAEVEEVLATVELSFDAVEAFVDG